MIHHSTIYHWVLQYSPVLSKNIRKRLNHSNDLWRLYETYLKSRGKDMYLYRAVDFSDNTIDFWLPINRDKNSAKSFLRRALFSSHNSMPRVITTDKYAATEFAIIAGVETLHMIHKEQAGTSNITEEVILINQLFGVAKNIVKLKSFCPITKFALPLPILSKMIYPKS